MKAIFGVFCRDADCLQPSLRENIQNIFNAGTLGDCLFWEGGIVLGQTFGSISSASQTTNQAHQVMTDHCTFVAVGRLDNSSDLCSLMNIPESDCSALSDYEVMRRTYATFGKECSSRMVGDWAFAAWNPAERQLVLTRSHYGSIVLYYHIDQHIIAFASSHQALLALKLVPVELDELWLAQRLISWSACYGERTPYKPIRCLPPANYLVATKNSYYTHRYWFPEDIAELRFSKREEYVESFRSIFDEAVRCRLRSDRPIAATLSGGLDSSSVSATAARFLAVQGQSLTAFTSVPLFDTRRYVSERFGDELPFAKATADYSGNIDLHPLVCSEVSPIMAIRRVLQLGSFPSHGAGNLYWLMAIQQSSRIAGCNVLLTGAAGNASISWGGDQFSQSWSFLLSHVAWRKLARDFCRYSKQQIISALPIGLVAAVQQHRMGQQECYRGSAINIDFARRLQLLEQRLHDPGERPARNARELRYRTLMLGRSVVGTYTAEIGAIHGLELRDPTADSRVIDFVFSVPDHIFMDPKTGIDRWLIREAMKGRLPDQVRLNRSRGRQAGDRVLRLRACSDEVEAAIEELAYGPAAEYIDVNYMRQVWRMIQVDDTFEAFSKSGTILLRGIMVGLFVNRYYD